MKMIDMKCTKRIRRTPAGRCFHLPTEACRMVLLIFLTGLLLVISYSYSQWRPKNCPPGSWRMPILGHTYLINQNLHRTGMTWKEKYGPVIGFDLFGYPAVMICDHKLIKEALYDPAFCSRPETGGFIELTGTGRVKGIVFSVGKHWQEQRRFAFRHLRDFGFGKKSMEAIIHEEVRELIGRLKITSGTPITLSDKFCVAVVNALWTVLAGQRFKHDDPDLNHILRLSKESLSCNSLRTLFSSFFPRFAKHGPNFLTQFKDHLELLRLRTTFFVPFIEAHWKVHDPDHPRDFIDVYISEMKNTTDSESSFQSLDFTDLASTISDLFIAGSDTTSTCLTWICLYMARHQYIQEKLQAEIDRVVGSCGSSRLPSLADRAGMPYTEAVLHEVMRKETLLPMSIPHAASQDVDFHGYHIPKGTAILPSIYEAHNNIKIWGDPENFRPERFLSKDGTQFVKHEGFLSFCTGKRACPGETFARDQLFLFTSALFQAFNVGLVPNSPPPTLDAIAGVVFAPKPHKLILRKRE